MPNGSSEGAFREYLPGMVEDIPVPLPIPAVSFVATISEGIHVDARRGAARPQAARQIVRPKVMAERRGWAVSAPFWG
ncbi:hypothetical protein H8A95_28795 [Bradyrhizobium sp. Pear76]|uniref:hypothetical protein n=1 Tax=Bradyrhizobium oropedii TaxID=1571201 RepID=UPI001E2F50E5|nr:hypothetical protein [Bradyrhizobium oropedii]MCC8966213.1 hypothetical protein [Bradyrhizobium oropedii]